MSTNTSSVFTLTCGPHILSAGSLAAVRFRARDLFWGKALTITGPKVNESYKEGQIVPDCIQSFKRTYKCDGCGKGHVEFAEFVDRDLADKESFETFIVGSCDHCGYCPDWNQFRKDNNIKRDRP